MSLQTTFELARYRPETKSGRNLADGRDIIPSSFGIFNRNLLRDRQHYREELWIDIIDHNLIRYFSKGKSEIAHGLAQAGSPTT
jgi:hypothetical protein